mgnify:FL=1
MKGENNYYKILGVHETASNHELRKAFCKRTKELHPDTTTLNLEDAKYKLQSVLEAYENLNNPNLRQIYDLSLKKENKKSTKMNINIMNSYFYDSNQNTIDGNRREFSNGEMFSLLLLGLIIFGCLIFAIIFALFNGKEIYSAPAWLIQ